MSRGTWDTLEQFCLSPTGLLPSVMGLSRPLRLGFPTTDESPATPITEVIGLGSSRFARRYSGNRVFFLFLRVLRCFSSPGCLLCTYFIQYRMYGYYSIRVAPFGDLRINACLRLPEAFRSLPRPSSTLGAKASTVRSYYLDLIISVYSRQWSVDSVQAFLFGL